MDQHCSVSTRKDRLSAELTSVSSATDDGTKKVLDSLGKFKTSQTVSQIKGRPYRSNGSDDESRGPSSSREKQEAKSRETSYRRTSTLQKDAAATTYHSQNSHSASVRDSDYSAAHEDKTTRSSSSRTPHHSTSDHLRGSSTVSNHKPSSSKETSSSNLRGSHRSSKSPKKESSGEKMKEKHDTLKERHQVDRSSKSHRNCEQSSSSNLKDKFVNQNKRDQVELQKRIEELKEEIKQERSKVDEIASRVGGVSLKSEKNNESSMRSSSSVRIGTESSKHERKDGDYRQKAPEGRSKLNETVSCAGDVSLKSERNKESISTSSLKTGTQSSKNDRKDDRVSQKSEGYRPKASQDPPKSGSGDGSRHQRQNSDRSCKSRSRSLERRIKGDGRNARSRSPSHSHGTSTAQNRNQDHDGSARSRRSRSVERRSHRSRSHGSRSHRSRSHSTQSHRSRSQSRNRRAGSRSRDLLGLDGKDKLYMKLESEKTRESPSLRSDRGQRRSKSPTVGKQPSSRSHSPCHKSHHNSVDLVAEFCRNAMNKYLNRSRSRSHSPCRKSHHDSVDRVADVSRNAVNKYLKSRQSPTIVRSKSRDRPDESSFSRRSPSSVCSLELDWPRSPCQPGTNLRARVDSISPLSQLVASGEAKVYKDIRIPVRRVQKKAAGDSGKFSKDWHLSGMLGPRLLVKRDAQRNSMVSIWTERTIDCFEVIRPIGRGMYGQVYKAADKDKNLLVAVKRITASSKHGLPLSAVREMMCLHLLDHPNIVQLQEIVRDTSSKECAEIMGMYYFVYEYIAHDLKGIIESKLVKLSPDNISSIMTQLLSALSYCHSRSLMHRNIKSSNILINYRGELKLTQFGMSRILHNTSQKERPYTTTVTSLSYRSPELLLGLDLYDTSVDMWSCGCVLGEMFLEKPVFPGQDDLHQLHLISTLCGSLNAAVWPNVTLLPLYYTVKSRAQQPRRLREDFCFLPVAALDLLDLLLTLDPKKRCTAAEALRMDWLRDINLHKLPPLHLPKTVDCHSLSEESKSESKSEVVTTGTKRPLSPDASQETRAKKRRDIGLVLREAFEALQQQPLNATDARSSLPTPESSAAARSIPETPASSKPLLLNLRVKDYQHQTVSPSKADYLQQKSSSVQSGLEVEVLLRQRHPDKKMSYYNQTNVAQSRERQSVGSVNKVTSLPGGDFSAGPGLGYKDLDERQPGIRPPVDKDVPTSSSGTSASVSLSSSSNLADPGLPESSVAFWNAMKVYCAKLDGSPNRGVTSATAEDQMTSEKSFHRSTSSSFAEAGYQPSGAREAENIMKPVRYPAHLYNDTSYGTKIQHQPTESDTDNDLTKVPRGSFPYNDGSCLSEVSGVRRPRLPAPPSRREPRHHETASLPNNSFDVNSRFDGYAKVYAEPQLYSGLSKGDTRADNPISTTASIPPPTRVHPVALGTSEKPLPYQETPTSVQSVRAEDSKPFDQVSGMLVSAASTAGTSTLQGNGEGPVSTNTRPKLMGILKNRMEVKTDSNVEWKTLQPKQ